jgi:hypothetical protein
LKVVTHVPKPQRTAADEAPLHYAACHAQGHSWVHRQRPVNDDDDVGFELPTGAEYGSVGLVSNCSTCATMRVRWVGRSGSRGPLRYYYPDGYQAKGEHLLPIDWRRAFVVRAFSEWAS